MDRIQPPPNYYGAPYPQGVEVGHPNFAPPPNLQSSSYPSKEYFFHIQYTLPTSL